MRRGWPLLLILLAASPSDRVAADPAQDADRPPDIDLPEGFAETTVADGINAATAMAVAPDGRVFVCEQTGALRVVKDDKLLPEPFVTVPVDSYWERGLIGVALDPDFPKNGYVYVCYVAAKPYPHHVVSRFTAKGDAAAPDSEKVLLEGDDQTKLGGSQPAGHQGGALHFGKDGKLYIAVGEQTAGAPSQRLDTFQGKLLRINPDGSIPEDNPFYGEAKGKYRAVWALGLRNPFAFAVQPGTGRILIDDVGDAKWEEIDEGAAGANYGWPESEGPTADPRFRAPLFAYDHGLGRSVTGGAFYNPPARQFPEKYVGKYFFLDYMDDWLRVLDPDDPKAAEVFATGLAAPVDVQTAPDGSLYVLNRRAWVRDDQFKPNTGTLHRIVYAGGADRPTPRITSQPTDCAATPGQAATFRVTAEGASPLRYQWLRDGKPVNDGDAAEFTLPAVKPGDHGAEFRCVVTNALGRTRSARAAVRVVAPRPPDAAADLTAGLNYSYYEGHWEYLPAFDRLTPTTGGSAKRFDPSPRGRDEDIGLVFDGFLDAPAEGAYTFDLAADGPAKLYVGGAEVVRLVATARRREASGAVGLQRGKHAVRLLYAHAAGRPELALRWSGPGVERREVPEERLSRTEPTALAAPVILPAGGEFPGPVAARLTTTTAGGVVRYTTDGAEPTADSPAYRGPFPLERSATVKARTFRPDGNESSSVASATFTISGTKPCGLPWRETAATLDVPADPADLPPTLSRTGVFRSLADLAPNPGLVPYRVNAPLWSDGADKRRWIALPGDARAGFAEKGEWKFPERTVFVKHFELADEAAPGKRRRLETRLLVVGRKGAGYGATYRWRPDGTDADLLPAGLTEEFTVKTADGPRAVKWTYPSRTDCLLCHTAAAGFVLGVKTRQLNGDFDYPDGAADNQLRTWARLGLLDPPPREDALAGYAKLAAVDDAAAPAELRVRSYLDANCAHCHRPGGARAAFDARFDTPLAEQKLIDGPLVAADLGVAGAKAVTPGDPGRSMLYLRMSRRRDSFDMPPLASHVADKEALAALAEWIKGLPHEPGRPGPNP